MKITPGLAVCAAFCVAAPLASAQSDPARAVAVQRPEINAQALQPAQGTGLRGLLRAGYEIIHIDAPAGESAARFILRKGEKIFSCEPLLFREGNASGGAGVRVIDQPCIDLTP